MVHPLAQLAVHRPRIALSALLLATGLMAIPAAQVGVDNSVDVWFVEGDPALGAYRAFQTRYGNDELVAIAVVEPDGVWSADALNRLLKLTDALEAIDGVDQVFSVPRALLTELRPDDAPPVAGDDPVEVLDVLRAMSGPVDAEGAAAVKRRIQGDPVLKGRLVNEQGTASLVLVQMDAMEDIDAQRHGVLVKIDDVLKTHAAGDTHVAGIGVVYDALNQISQVEGGIFMGAAFLVIFLLLWPLFRSGLAVGVSAGAVACAVVLTRGAYGLAGGMENMVTMTLPVLVLILGVADCVHILRYRAAHPDLAPADALARILKPCFFTTLTTMVGFAALATSKMAVVRQLGIFAALGIGFAFISSAICCGAAMSRPTFVLRPPGDPREGRIGRVLLWTARYATSRREVVLGVTGIAILLGAYGLSRVEVDTYSLGFLDASHVARKDSDAMEALLGPYTPLELELVSKADTPEPVKEPEILRAVFAFQQALESEFPDRVRETFSLADVVARLHQVNGGPGTPYEVPDDPFMVAANVEVYSGDPDSQLDRLADGAFTRLRLTVQVPMLSARGYESMIDDTLALAQKHLPESIDVQANGYLPLYVKMMDYVVDSQVQSFGWAFVIVFFLVGILFRSARMSALSVLPNVLPVFVTLGVMGALGINLDVATVTITSIVIGIVVDDTIHYLHRFRVELERSEGDYLAAASQTAVAVGRSVGATSVIFALGFSLLAFASVKSIVYFGLLTALAMIVALLGDLFVLPAILVALKPVISNAQD